MIRLICVGALKEQHFRQASQEYQKRMKTLRMQTIEVKPQRDANPDIIREKEATEILEKIPAETRLIVLDENGTQKTSIELAKTLDADDVTFIIGGAHGLSKKITESADETLSLSKMTLPHQLARIILTEQIYRAQTIMEGKKYHK
jgi:23S rRNA (pseudouridine1915-N3)-methyltransferase